MCLLLFNEDDTGTADTTTATTTQQPSQYRRTIEWLRDLLYSTAFEADRIRVAAQRMIGNAAWVCAIAVTVIISLGVAEANVSSSFGSIGPEVFLFLLSFSYS